MTHPGRHIVRYERISGVLHALWDDGNGNRHYAPVEDEAGEPNW